MLILKSLQTQLQRTTAFIINMLLLLFTHTAVAALPKPASYEYAQDGDWIKVAETIGDKATHVFLIFLGVALLGGVFSGILRGYQSAQERQEMSHFFKAVGVGLICLALGLGLLYGAQLVIKK